MDVPQEFKDILVYVATPFTHDETVVENNRAALVGLVSAKLELAGISVFSPITHSEGLRKYAEFDGTYETWKKTDRLFVQKLDEIWILKIKGWRESEGVTDEIAWAVGHCKPVKYIVFDQISNVLEIKDSMGKLIFKI